MATNHYSEIVHSLKKRSLNIDQEMCPIQERDSLEIRAVKFGSAIGIFLNDRDFGHNQDYSALNGREFYVNSAILFADTNGDLSLFITHCYAKDSEGKPLEVIKNSIHLKDSDSPEVGSYLHAALSTISSGLYFYRTVGLELLLPLSFFVKDRSYILDIPS